MTGCATDADQLPVNTTGTVNVNMALNVLSMSDTRGITRMSPAAVVDGESFSGINDLYVVPFVIPEDRDTVQKDDTPKTGSLTDFNPNTTVNTHYLTENTDLSVGTNAFLCYAKAKPLAGTAYDAATDGSLTEKLSTVLPTVPTVVSGSPADITFSLTPIQQTHATEAAVKILDYMNSIAVAGSWNTQAPETDAGKLFKTFVNMQSGTPQGFGGSASNIIAYVNDWYEKASGIAAINTAIREAIQNTSLVDVAEGKVTAIKDAGNYPEGLPDGGAIMTWNSTYQKFEYDEVKWDDTKSKYVYNDTYDKFKDYVYPAARYFYANSRIYTSNSARKDAYDEDDWDDVLSVYENQGTDSRGVAVDVNTRSVVVKDPLHYGVAGMKITIKANTEADDRYLRDDINKHDDPDDSKVPLTATTFPLTAVIIGSQVQQNYCFEPAFPNNKTEQEYAVYDTHVEAVKTEGDDPATVCLGETYIGHPSAPIYTLGLQTKDELSLKVVLEFQNNSGKEFKTENGIICKDTKFYMVASVVPPGENGVERRVMTRGYMTTVNLTIRSLKSAYNALPDLTSDKLRLFDTVEAGIRKWQDGQSGDHEFYNW
jgi:hypothetical protein